MADYITRVDALDAFSDSMLPKECPSDLRQRRAYLMTLHIHKIIREEIGKIPAADVEPVRHGRWIWHEETFEYECSDCHCRFDYEHTYELFDHGFQFANYCPKCGANMDGENAETTKPSSRSLGLLPCPVCHRHPNLRFWGDSDYYFECHIAHKLLEPQEHFPTVRGAAEAWNKEVRRIEGEMNDDD